MSLSQDNLCLPIRKYLRFITLPQFFNRWTSQEKQCPSLPQVSSVVICSDRSITSGVDWRPSIVVFVISTFPAIATIDRIGRRPLLIIGGSGMALMLILLAALTATYQPEWNDSAAAWTTATFIWLYTAFFGTSWGAFDVVLPYFNLADS